MVRPTEQSRARLRWQTVEEEPTLPGFTERVTYPEFRGVEFLHVRAKSIINHVPAASRMPFEWTINAYRGCTHACSYCLVGETPILMGDGRTRPLADVRPGDVVYGTVRHGSDRRYVRTPVLDHWETVKPAYRVTLEDGTELVASGDHRFLTNRGWRHVVGAEQGPLQRPFLASDDRLVGTGGFAAPPKDDEEYRRGYLCGIIRCDADLEALERARAYFRDYAVWPGSREVVGFVRDLVKWPSRPSAQWRKGFLAGIFDAGGSRSHGVLRVWSTDEEILRWTQGGLRALGFDVAIDERQSAEGTSRFRVRGGLRERLRFFHTVDPAATPKRDIEGVAVRSGAPLRVVSVEPLGIEVLMYDITTGTGDFIANGVVSHNCFARPTHTYLDLDAGEDFQRRIVVKINAVERLRAELTSSKWRGDHVALGTNTDPYQRCEGRYRLTRGIVGTLTAAGNPYSVLTKGTLALRDLDLFVEAERRTGVAVNFSVGTLDEAVWRLSEPGTPDPARRIDAVATLNEAGVPSGVMVAPIIPGMSDAPDQLEAVVKAAVAAGARFITPIVLHLRPGVRDVFLPWLADVRPDLVDRYRRLYPRSYAPKAEQQRITRLVRRLVERHAGPGHPLRSPRDARRLPRATAGRPASTREDMPVADQLRLDL